MNVGDDVNIIAMAKVIKDDELDGEEKPAEKHRQLMKAASSRWNSRKDKVYGR